MLYTSTIKIVYILIIPNTNGNLVFDNGPSMRYLPDCTTLDKWLFDSLI